MPIIEDDTTVEGTGYAKPTPEKLSKKRDRDEPELAFLVQGLSASEAWKACVYWYFPCHVSRLRLDTKAHGPKRISELRNKWNAMMTPGMNLHTTDQVFHLDGYKWNMTGRDFYALNLALYWMEFGGDMSRMGSIGLDWPDLPRVANLDFPREEIAKMYPPPKWLENRK